MKKEDDGWNLNRNLLSVSKHMDLSFEIKEEENGNHDLIAQVVISLRRR